MLNDLTRYEDDHAIPRGELTKRGWKLCLHDDRPALTFPTDSGPRWRFADGAKPKYDQPVGYKACWYGLTESARMRFAFLIDCNGAASTIAALCAGLPAFSYQSGEKTTPTSERIAELKAALAGRRIWVAFDCDKDGHDGAIKRVQLYQASGIQAEALNLALPTVGGDLADFIGAHKGQELTSLLRCKRLDIPAPEPPRPKYAPKEHDDVDTVELAQLALDAISRTRLDSYDEWVLVGMSLKELGEAGLAMWDHWSSGHDSYKPGECAKKFRGFSGKKTLGSLFYMADTDSPGWRPRNPPPIRRGGGGEVANQPDYPDELPIAVRATLNAYAYPAIAPVLELWFEGMEHGYIIEGEPQTFECLKYVSEKLNRGVSDRTIRAGLTKMADPHHGQFLTFTSRISISREENTTQITEDPCRCPGRKATYYQLQPWTVILANLAKLAIVPILKRTFPADDPLVAPMRAEFLAELGRDDAPTLAKALNAKYADVLAKQPGYRQALAKARQEYNRVVWLLSNPQHAPIPKDWTYKNATEYKGCCARAIVEAAGGTTQYSRKQLCEKIGTTERSLSTVLKRAGIWVAKDQTVDVPVPNLDALKQVGGYSKTAKGAPVAVVSAGKVFPFDGKGMLTWAEGEFRSGRAVRVRYHQANLQLLDTVEQLHKSGPRLTYAAIVFMARLLNWFLRALAAEEAFAAKKTGPVARLTPWRRLAKQLRIAALVGLLAISASGKPAAAGHRAYGEVQLRKLLDLATPYPTGTADAATGEIVPHSLQMTLSLLLEKPNEINHDERGVPTAGGPQEETGKAQQADRQGQPVREPVAAVCAEVITSDAGVSVCRAPPL